MNDNAFFKPTPLYKEFMILDMIEKNPKITQRKVSDYLGVAVSMINHYIDTYEAKGYVKRKYNSYKNVEYHITKKGLERKKFLNISYLNASQKIYYSAKENIVVFLEDIIKQGYKNILLYGAGEVAEIMLQVINDDQALGIKVAAVIDDDKEKQGTTLLGYKIMANDGIDNYAHDGILISSYGHSDAIYKKLIGKAYPKDQIIGFF